jgi:hypothetical protein
MGTRGFTPWMSHEIIFQTSNQYVKEIQSYWSANAGYRNWVLMVVRANDLKCSLMFWINYMVTIEFPFTYPFLYNPLFFDLWASLAPFSFGESERSLGVRDLLEIFERREDLVWVFKIFHSIQFGRVRKNFLSMKTQTSHLFSQLKELFHQLQNFFFHRTPLDTLFHHGLQKRIFTQISYISKSNETCFYMILHENLIIWSHVHFFSFWSNFHHLHMILVV